MWSCSCSSSQTWTSSRTSASCRSPCRPSSNRAGCGRASRYAHAATVPRPCPPRDVPSRVAMFPHTSRCSLTRRDVPSRVAMFPHTSRCSLTRRDVPSRVAPFQRHLRTPSLTPHPNHIQALALSHHIHALALSHHIHALALSHHIQALALSHHIQALALSPHPSPRTLSSYPRPHALFECSNRAPRPALRR
jgi:hypothetical protein